MNSEVAKPPSGILNPKMAEEKFRLSRPLPTPELKDQIDTRMGESPRSPGGYASVVLASN